MAIICPDFATFPESPIHKFPHPSFYMKKALFFSIFSAFLIFACTPKSSDKMSGTPAATAPAAASASAGSKAPAIPMPTGDVRKAAPKAGEAPKIQIGKAETFRLDNGLTVIVVENHKLPKVSYRVFVDNGPTLEKDAAGYVDMMGDLLSKGTTTHTKAQIDEAIDFVGASLTSDANGVRGSCLTKHSDKLLTLLSDVLLNPAFPATEFDKAKRRAESSLAQSKDNASTIAGNVGSVVRFGKGHPYGEVMTEATLGKITLDLMKNHYNTFFKPNISYLVIVGDISRTKAEQQAKQYFGKWAKGDVPAQKYAMPRAPEKAQVEFVHKPGAVQSVFSVTYPIDLKPGTPDVIRARLANTILGAYFNSRVNANLREGHGWTYGAGTNIQSDELVGSFRGGASVRNAVTDSAIVEFLKEMKRLGTEKVPDQELQVVKNVLTGEFSRSLEEPGTVAQFALNTARFKLPADYYEKYLATLQNVTADEVMAIAQKYIHPEQAHIVVVGDKGEVSEKLAKFAADGKVVFFDSYGDLVRATGGVVPAGMTAEKVIEDYLNTIGGKTKIAAVKDLQSMASMNMNGMQLNIQTAQKGGNKIAIDMKMNGQVVSRQVFDGTKGSQTSMGQTEALEGEQLADLKEQAAFAKEAGYVSLGYKLALKGTEDINSSAAYVVEVTRPDGKKITEYYDIKSALKVREVTTTTGADGNPATQTIDMADYKPEGGIMIPRTLTLSGMFPFPVKVVMSEVKVNAGVEESNFKM